MPDTNLIFETGSNNVALSCQAGTEPFSGQKDLKAGVNRTTLEQSMAYTAGEVLDCALQASAPSQARLDEQELKLFLNGCALFSRAISNRRIPESVVPIFSQIIASAPLGFQPAWSKLLLGGSSSAGTEDVLRQRCRRSSGHIREKPKLNPGCGIFIAGRFFRFRPSNALAAVRAGRQLDRQPRPAHCPLGVLRGIRRNNDCLEDVKELSRSNRYHRISQ